jgi:hypothetical protein
MRRQAKSDFMLPLSACFLALGMAIVLNRHDPSMRWNAPIFRTGVVFYTVLEINRKYWNRQLFWTLFTAALVLHLVAIWILMHFVLRHHQLPMMATIPLTVIETIALLYLLNDKRLRKRSGSTA